MIAQHSDHDPAFQQRALTLMKAAARTELAYLTDRVAVNHGRPQVYGIQVTCIGEELGPAPLIDPEHGGLDDELLSATRQPLYAADAGGRPRVHTAEQPLSPAWAGELFLPR